MTTSMEQRLANAEDLVKELGEDEHVAQQAYKAAEKAMQSASLLYESARDAHNVAREQVFLLRNALGRSKADERHAAESAGMRARVQRTGLVTLAHEEQRRHIPHIVDIEVTKDRDEEGTPVMNVTPVWSWVDRPRSFSWQVTPALAPRLVRAIRAGVAFGPAHVATDVYNQTYAQADAKFHGRHLNADLKRLGF